MPNWRHPLQLLTALLVVACGLVVAPTSLAARLVAADPVAIFQQDLAQLSQDAQAGQSQVDQDVEQLRQDAQAAQAPGSAAVVVVDLDKLKQDARALQERYRQDRRRLQHDVAALAQDESERGQLPALLRQAHTQLQAAGRAVQRALKQAEQARKLLHQRTHGQAGASGRGQPDDPQTGANGANGASSDSGSADNGGGGSDG